MKETKEYEEVKMARKVTLLRLNDNLRETKHPFHHKTVKKTVKGTIVEPDPVLEYVLSRLPAGERRLLHMIYDPIPEQEAQTDNMAELNEDEQMEAIRTIVLLRLNFNLRETHHPFHHKTADGTIVDADPTLEHFLSRLSAGERELLHMICDRTPEQEARALKAVPVDRMHYGFNLYGRRM